MPFCLHHKGLLPFPILWPLTSQPQDKINLTNKAYLFEYLLLPPLQRRWTPFSSGQKRSSTSLLSLHIRKQGRRSWLSKDDPVTPPHESNHGPGPVIFQSYCSLYTHPNSNTFWITIKLQFHLNFSRFLNSLRRSYNRDLSHVIVKPKWSLLLNEFEVWEKPAPSSWWSGQISRSFLCV